MTTIVRRLEALRRRARAVLVAERTAVLLAFACAAIGAWIALDAIARFPMAIRLVALFLGVGAAVLAVLRWWWPAAQFRPPLTEIALRVERQRPELAGELASSVDFQSRRDRGALEARTIDRTEQLAGNDRFGALIRRDRLGRALVGLFVALAVATALVIADPSGASIGLRRALLPWSGAEWPARTVVASLMQGVTHLPKGDAVLLRAEAVRGDPASMRPFVRYRMVREGTPGPWRDAALARQEGGVFERPIDADADGIEFMFGTTDAMTERASIELVTPPAVVRAVLHAQPPAYAQSAVEPTQVDLGPGTDARAALATPLLAGSEIDLSIELTRPIPVPTDASERDEWARRTLGAALPAGAWVEADGSSTDRIRLRARVEEDLDIPVSLRDEHGIVGDDGVRFNIPISPDRTPSVSITEPSADEVVLPTATVRVVAEARDDVALDELGVRIERQGAEPREQRRKVSGETASFDLTFTPEAMGAAAGETLLVSGVTTDGFEVDGVRREATVSPARRIRVVGEEEFTRQIRTQLASVRQSAMRAESTQRDIAATARPEEGLAATAADQARRQAQLSDRVRTMRDAVAALDARARSGGLEREALAEIMRQAQDLLDAAGAASAEAAEQLGAQASAEARAGEPARSEGAEAQASQTARAEAQASADSAASAQEEVAAELEDLVKLLDRDEDAWVATRRIERLGQDIARLLEETQRVGERTVGRDPESLSAEERLELERLAGRNRAGADQARETLEELRDRAERLAQADRSRAAGMREAARRGEERNLARRLEEAAVRTAQNQPANAEQSLREAAETAQSMKEAIQDDRRSRVEELRRRLADLEQSLRQLVVQAETSIAALRAIDADATASALAPLVSEVVSLDRNIGAVTDDARTGGGTDRAARLLERAGERSAVAVARLRVEPADRQGSEDALARARDLLAETLEVVAEQRRQAESQQAEERRRELAAVMSALAERQAGVRSASEPLLNADPRDRRKLVESRRLSVEQELVRTAVQDLSKEHSELVESALFESARGRLDAWMKRSAEHLAQVAVTPRTLADQQLAAETLAMMGQALSDRSADDDPFAEAMPAGNEGEGGEGGQAGEQRPPGIPPVAELRLLRETQAQLARRTRTLDEAGLAPDDRAAELKELARLQQELMEQGEAWVARLRQQEQGGVAPSTRQAPAPANEEEDDVQ